MNILNDGTVVNKSDESLVVRFYLGSHINEIKTKEMGMDQFDSVENVEILIPGCRDNIDRRATDQDKMRFRRQYEAFLNTKKDIPEGTPLSQFPFISSSERKELEYCNIYTGESLINMSDGYIDSIPLDVRPLINKVRAFMALAKDSAATLRYAEENEALKKQIDLMQDQMNQILHLKTQGEEDGKRIGKRGRPKVGISADTESHTPH